MDDDVERRAALHAALGEPVRLAIVDALAASDLAPSALAARFGLAGNLLAHHLDVLEHVGLIRRTVSSGDRRRRYVRLHHHALAGLHVGDTPRRGRALFVCTHNSARSQLAAALWRRRTGDDATSAGTHPADAVHPGAVAAAERAGLPLGEARPRTLTDDDLATALVITVCDRAHEELRPTGRWLHWSVADPVAAGDAAAFDAALAEIDHRIAALAGTPGTAPRPGVTMATDTPPNGPAPEPTPAVLFLCVHNAGRSQMAAGWLRHLAGDAVDVFSGGSQPAEHTNAAAVEAMAEVGIDISAERPRPWSDEIARTADVIVTMGCGDACPVYPGTRYEDWELTDPAGQPVDVVRGVRDDIEGRVRALMASLDVPARA